MRDSCKLLAHILGRGSAEVQRWFGNIWTWEGDDLGKMASGLHTFSPSTPSLIMAPARASHQSLLQTSSKVGMQLGGREF